MKKEVAIVMGSDSDLGVMKDAAEILESFGIKYHLSIVSAHRTPDRLFDFAKTAEKKGFKVIIAGAGGSAPGQSCQNGRLPGGERSVPGPGSALPSRRRRRPDADPVGTDGRRGPTRHPNRASSDVGSLELAASQPGNRRPVPGSQSSGHLLPRLRLASAVRRPGLLLTAKPDIRRPPYVRSSGVKCAPSAAGANQTASQDSI